MTFFYFFFLQIPFWTLIFSNFFQSPLTATEVSLTLGGSVFFSLVLSHLIRNLLKRQALPPDVTENSRLILMSVLFTGVLFFRTSHSIYDILFPTDLIGMTHRWAQGYIPVSFSALPDLTANYHNTFIIFSGLLNKFFFNSSVLSVLFTFLLGSFLLFCLYNLHSKERGLSLTESFLCIFIFVFSCSWPQLRNFFQYQPAGFYEYLMPADTLLSNSWVFGSILLLMLFRIWSWNFKNELGKFFLTLFILILLISTNPGMFTMGLISASLSFGLATLINPKMKFIDKMKRGLLMAMSSGFVYFLTSKLASAFLKGDRYRFVHPRLRSTSEDLVEIVEYLRLAGFLPWAILILAIKYRKTGVSIHIWSFLILTFFFPLFFSIEGVSRWDAIHKNAFITILACAFILPYFIRRIKPKILYAVILLFALAHSSHYYDYFNVRSGVTNFFWTEWLNQEKRIKNFELNKQISVIYPMTQVNTESLLPNSLMGHFTRNSFYPGFLVNVPLEDWPSDENWKTPERISKYIRPEKLPTWVQIRQNEEPDFQKNYEKFQIEKPFQFKIDFSKKLTFEGFTYFPLYWKN